MPEPKSPYVGPAPIDDAALFFGREKETEDLIVRLKASHSVLLHSPSGAGKTSLIKSGLIPGLGEDYLVLPVMRVGRLPQPGALPEGTPFNRYLLSALGFLDAGLPEEKQTPPSGLASLGLLEYLQARLPDFAAAARDRDTRRILLVFDQFEELLTADALDRPVKETFLGELMAVLYENRFWALFALREDYLARLEPYLSYFPDRLSARFRLEFLEPPQAMQAIQQPVVKFGVTFQDEAARQLVTDLRQVYTRTPQGEVKKEDGPFVEPVQLQVVCSNIWAAQRPDPAQITLQDVLEFGDVDKALGNYYAERIARIAAESGNPERNLREWIETRLITPQGLRIQALSGPDPEFGLDEATIRKIIDAYLVREDQRRGAAWLELAHDRLVEPIRSSNAEWFEKNLLLIQRRAPQWEREERPDGLLLRGKDFEEALAWKKTGATLKPLEEALLEASQAWEKARQNEVNLQIKTQIAERQRRLLVATSILAVIALFAMGVAIVFQQQERATKSTVIAALTAINQGNATQTAAALQGTRAIGAEKQTQTISVFEGAQTQTAVSIQNAALAMVRQSYETATAEFVQAGQLAQAATRGAGGAAPGGDGSPPPATAPVLLTALPGETSTPTPRAVPTTQVDQLLSVAEQLKDNQPNLALLLGAIAYEESNQDPLVGGSLSRLAQESIQGGLDFSFEVANLGQPIEAISVNPDGTLIELNSVDGGFTLVNEKLEPAGVMRGVPANPSNYFHSPAGDTLVLSGPRAEGVAVYWSEYDTIIWSQVVRENISFAALRVTSDSDAANNSLGDKNKFPTSWATLIGGDYQDLIRGAYWEFDPGRDPVEQIDEFYALVTDRSALGPSRVWPQTGDLPLILRLTRSGGLGSSDLAILVKRALDHLEELDPQGRMPIVYTETDFWNATFLAANGDSPAWSGDYPLWVENIEANRNQPRLPQGWSSWDFWDYRTCGAGACELPTIGDQSPYQRTRFNGTMAQLEDFVRKPNTQQALRDRYVNSKDVDSGRQLRTLAIDPALLTSLTGSRDGTILVTGRSDGRVYRWDGRAIARPYDPNELPYAAATLFAKLSVPVVQLAIANNNRWVATVTEKGEEYLWDLNMPAETSTGARLLCSRAPRADPIFSQDSLWAAATSPNGICLWDLRPFEAGFRSDPFQDTRLRDEHTAIQAVAFSPDSRYFAAAGADSVVRVWDLRSLNTAPLAIEIPKTIITSLAYSTDGTLLAIGATDGRVWVYNLQAGPPAAQIQSISNELRTLNTARITAANPSAARQVDRALFELSNQTGINSLAFHPANPDLLLAGEQSGLARGWDINLLSDPLALACRLAGSRRPTLQELKAIGLDTDQILRYRDICD